MRRMRRRTRIGPRQRLWIGNPFSTRQREGSFTDGDIFRLAGRSRTQLGLWTHRHHGMREVKAAVRVFHMTHILYRAVAV